MEKPYRTSLTISMLPADLDILNSLAVATGKTRSAVILAALRQAYAPFARAEVLRHMGEIEEGKPGGGKGAG